MEDYSTAKSAYTCDCCLRPAVYYSISGRYKTKTRCYKHLPTDIVIDSEIPQYRRSVTRPSVLYKYGITLAMQKEIDDCYYRNQPLK